MHNQSIPVQKVEHPASLATSLPDTNEFREWVAAAILSLGVSVSGLSIRAGLSANALAQFLNRSGSGIQLESARNVAKALADEAQQQGITLPGGVQ